MDKRIKCHIAVKSKHWPEMCKLNRQIPLVLACFPVMGKFKFKVQSLEMMEMFMLPWTRQYFLPEVLHLDVMTDSPHVYDDTARGALDVVRLLGLLRPRADPLQVLVPEQSVRGAGEHEVCCCSRADQNSWVKHGLQMKKISFHDCISMIAYHQQNRRKKCQIPKWAWNDQNNRIFQI